VKFHDGSDFNADAAIWNLDRYFKKDAKQFDPPGGAVAQARNPFVAGYRKIDDNTIEFTNPRPLSYFPNMLPYMLYSSPAQFEKTGSWAEFAKSPSGTGPFKITEFKPRVSVTLSRTTITGKRIAFPKLDKMVLFPMPEATTRLAALRSGQVDWIEVPPPDAVPSLKGAGFEIVTGSYPHMWPWVFNLAKDDSPWKDVRVRRALNYCLNREGLVTLLNGLAEPSVGAFKPADPSFGSPKEQYKYDPTKGKALLKEAGYGSDKPVKAKVMISTSGSGQMLPLPMNEYLQQNLKECGFDISFEVVEWGTMLVALRNAPTGAAGSRLGRHEHQPAAFHRHFPDRPLLPVLQCGAERPQLGQLEERGVRHADRPDREVERQGADTQGHPARPRDHRRRSALGVHRPRPQSASDDQEGQGLRQRAELVSGLHERGHGVIVVGVPLLFAWPSPRAVRQPT
jgi:ABC-type transport system substrate-binding protein